MTETVEGRKEELKEEILLMEEAFGRTPLLDDLRWASEYDKEDYEEVFGGWGNAMEELGFGRSGRTDRKSNRKVLLELRRVGDELEKAPTMDEFDSMSEMYASSFSERFGGWIDALEKAGLDPDSREFKGSNTKVPDSELLEEMKRVDSESEDRVTIGLMNQRGKYSANVYKRAFGSWSNALEKAGIDTSGEWIRNKR